MGSKFLKLAAITSVAVLLALVSDYGQGTQRPAVVESGGVAPEMRLTDSHP